MEKRRNKDYRAMYAALYNVLVGVQRITKNGRWTANHQIEWDNDGRRGVASVDDLYCEIYGDYLYEN